VQKNWKRTVTNDLLEVENWRKNVLHVCELERKNEQKTAQIRSEDVPVLAFLSEYGSLGGGLLNNVRHGEGGGGAAGQRPHVHHAQDVAPTVPEQLTAYNHC
jgi:hypothetical protein